MLSAVVALAASVLFWTAIVVVIPGVFAIYVAMLFPLTGQWRKRWRERRTPKD